ncbi:MAG: ATP-dependent zinc metalloprotease FtsH [Bacilli bacterium]|nr:ATP-dependent zinc metalloprotease FtsH [Bacilli bacterium]
MNEKRPRRGLGSYLVYLLVLVGVGLIVFFSIRSLINPTTTWNVSQLDALLNYNQTSTTQPADKVEPVYIQSVYVSQNPTTTIVSGTAYTRKSNSSRISYTVNVLNTQWNETFEVSRIDSNGVVTIEKHPSYSSLFKGAIAEWNELYATSKAPVNERALENIDNPYQVSFWDTWGPTIIQFILLIGVAVFFSFFLNRSVGGANRQAMDFNKSTARRETSKVKFADVAGCDEEKAEMVEMVEYLKEPKKYSKYGARLPKGVLLIGNPGTGKTLLAKAVAGEAGVPFYSISGSDFVEMFVGVGAGRVRDLFLKAKQSAPCIVFIDEIDAVGRQRGAGLGGGNDEREQTLNQLLVEMDGFEHNAGILVMAATNRDDVLDPALLRPGRFDRIITVSLPNAAGREAIFKVHARNKKIGADVDFKALAQRTVGFSGADIENILNEAAILAVRFHKDDISMAEIDEAIDRRIAGPAKSNKGLNERERRQVAFHESGHAVIGLVLPHAEKVQKITIIPRGQTGGHVLMTPEDDRFLLTKKELLAQITGLLGGRTSEEIFFDDVSTGAQNDIQQATRIARMMVTELGMSELGPIQYESATGSVFLGRDYANTQRNFSSEVAYEIDKAIRDIIEAAHIQAREILLEHKKDVQLIAETLLKQETITAEEIDALIKSGALPAKEVQTVQETDVLKEDKPAEEKPAEEKPASEEAPKKKAAPRKKKVEKPVEEAPVEEPKEEKPEGDSDEGDK